MSRPPAGVLSIIGNEEVSEQWAPMSGEGESQWVMVGTRGHNTAVQCLTHDQLYGDDTEADLTPDKKQYIMCCDPRPAQLTRVYSCNIPTCKNLLVDS